MFNTVMWATDGSDSADQAMGLAKTLASDSGGRLIVAHCEELMPPAKGGGGFPIHGDAEELKAKIQRQVAELSGEGIQASVEMLRTTAGHAAHEIADSAREQGAEVIVVGTRGHTALKGLLVGSVTQRLLHVAPCPVLAVPTNERSA
jgi:nucleotide-binding universal stress UspA family protein